MKNFIVRKGLKRAYISIFKTFSNAYTHTNKLRHIIMHICRAQGIGTQKKWEYHTKKWEYHTKKKSVIFSQKNLIFP